MSPPEWPPEKEARATGGGRNSYRLVAIDAARAVAVIGMIAVNVGPTDGQGLAHLLYRLPLGRASLLFVVLAGLGLSLLTRRARRTGGRLPWGTVMWRAGLLLVGGLALQLLDHGVNVILSTYAVLFVLALPLCRAPDRVVAALAGLLVALGPVVWIVLQMTRGESFALAPATLTAPLGQVVERVLVSGPYPVLTWSGPFLTGMWLGRLDLTSRRVQRWMLIGGVAAMIGGRLVSVLLVALLGEPAPAVGFDRLTTAVAHSQMPLWLLSGIGTAVLVLGLLLRTWALVERWLWPLVPTGQLALTIYVGHLLILDFFVRPEPHGLAEGVGIAIGLAAGAVLFATLWPEHLGRGPFEKLLRPPWLSLGRRAPSRGRYRSGGN